MATRIGKRKTAHAREIISRSGVVTGWVLDVHAWTTDENSDLRERKDSLNLSVRGTFTEEIFGVTKFDFLIYPVAQPDAGRAEIPCVGTFFRSKPVLDAVITLSDLHFQTLVSVAVAGKLGSLDVTFQKLRYGSGLISSLLLSTSKTVE